MIYHLKPKSPSNQTSAWHTVLRDTSDSAYRDGLCFDNTPDGRAPETNTTGGGGGRGFESCGILW